MTVEGRHGITVEGVLGVTVEAQSFIGALNAPVCSLWSSVVWWILAFVRMLARGVNRIPTFLY